MDIKAYIESGILEQYVIGTLSAIDAAEVEKNISLYPEITIEIKAIEITLEAYAKHKGVSPKLSEETLIENLRKSNLTTNTTIDKNKSIDWLKYMGWALSIGLLAYLFSTSKNNANLLQQSKRNQQLIDSITIACAETGTENQILNQKIQLLNNPKSKFLLLAGTPLSPNSYASVIIDSTNRKLFFDFAGLPKPPTGKQFQLWVIKGGKPIDMGVINNDNIAIINNVEKEFITEAQAFALTLEDTGGKPSPTLDQMYVVGGL